MVLWMRNGKFLPLEEVICFRHHPILNYVWTSMNKACTRTTRWFFGFLKANLTNAGILYKTDHSFIHSSIYSLLDLSYYTGSLLYFYFCFLFMDGWIYVIIRYNLYYIITHAKTREDIGWKGTSLEGRFRQSHSHS